MAKKIIIQFNDQPSTTSTGFIYNIQVNTIDITYSNGKNFCRIDWINAGATPTEDYQVNLGTTLDLTIQNTLSFLQQNYQNYIIDYNIVGQTIEVTAQADCIISIDPVINDFIEITTIDIEPANENLKYYIIFDDYTLNIYKKNYLGSATEIFGTFTLKKSSVETILTPIRGTGLDLQLEANQALTYDEFLLEDEFTFKVELLKNTDLIYKGYVKPDGCQQSFIADIWYVNIETVDGLGLLKDLSFVQSNGLRFTGKLSIYDVIKGCLDRTRLTMDVLTSIDLEYVGYTGTNVIKDVYVNSERFIKQQQDEVIMDCNEVLTSMLNLMSTVITQQDGKWFIYRPNDLESGIATFTNQTNDTTQLYNFNATLGSQINNFYPHHCGSDQQIEVRGAISAYRLNYKYGFLDGYIKNTNLSHNDEMVYTDWTTNPDLPIEVTDTGTYPEAPYIGLEIINNPLNSSGLELAVREGVPFLTEVLTSTSFTGLQGRSLIFRFKASTIRTVHYFNIQVKTSDGYYLSNDNEWVTDSNAHIILKCGNVGFTEYFITHERLMPPLNADCDITVVICSPTIYVLDPSSPFYYLTKKGLSKVSYVQILDNTYKESGIVGEFHTVSRKNPPSSITKENQVVYNGDGEIILIGSIYTDDLETPTEFWTRKNKAENLSLLGISAMDDLRIQSAPIKLFSGSIFGEIKYMSVVTIDGISGKFMPIHYDYDYKTNISQVKLLQFYTSDLGDIDYVISPDYGNDTIKPTIKS